MKFSGAELGSDPWLIDQVALLAVLARLDQATPEAIDKAHAQAMTYGEREPALQMVGDIAVINAAGPITYRRSWFSMYFGAATIEDMQQQLQLALGDAAVRTIVFRWHSPGGCVEMVPEFADALFTARGQKPIISIADTAICSAAYWLASQTDAIYATESANIGAVGASSLHQDVSAMLEKIGIKMTFIVHGANKVAGNPYEPLSETARASLQARIDDLGGEFDADVARGRGVSKKVVLETFGQGEVYRGKKAIALGMADKPGTFTQVLGRLTKTRTKADGLVPTSAAARKACADCGTSACPCEEPSCPEECPTCDPECSCIKGSASKKAAAAELYDGISEVFD